MIESANKQQNLKEIHRVAEVVERITKECLIVPKNSFKLKTGSFLEKIKYFKFEIMKKSENQNEDEPKSELEVKISLKQVIFSLSKTVLTIFKNLIMNKLINF